MSVTTLIDRLIGSAYPNVRIVAENIEAIKHVSENMETIFAEAVNLTNFVSVPASAVASGTPGQYSANATHFFICYATNSWRRVSIATW